MEDWNGISKNLSEVLGVFTKRTEQIRNEVTETLNNFAKSEEFQRLVEIFLMMSRRQCFFRSVKVCRKKI